MPPTRRWGARSAQLLDGCSLEACATQSVDVDQDRCMVTRHPVVEHSAADGGAFDEDKVRLVPRCVTTMGVGGHSRTTIRPEGTGERESFGIESVEHRLIARSPRSLVAPDI